MLVLTTRRLGRGRGGGGRRHRRTDAAAERLGLPPGDPVLHALALMVAVTNLIDIAFSAVLVPVWAHETGGGAAVDRPGVRGLERGVGRRRAVAARWGDRLPRFQVYVAAFLLAGAPKFVVMALGAPAGRVLAVFVVGGFASGFLNPILGAVIYERIPDGLVGRVSSLSTAICFALMPLGGLVGGLLVSSSACPGAGVIGAAYFLVTMAPAVDPRWPRDGPTAGDGGIVGEEPVRV